MKWFNTRHWMMMEGERAAIDKDSMLWLERFNRSRSVSVISTGSLNLDIALGVGGLPKGRMVEIYGKDASGKTTLALHIVKEAQKLGGHVSFIKDVAATEPPLHLPHLLKVLQTRGDTIISPGAKEGLIPLAIPLSKNASGSVTALLRWPTAPPGLDMPVVEVWRSGVRLIARNESFGVFCSLFSVFTGLGYLESIMDSLEQVWELLEAKSGIKMQNQSLVPQRSDQMKTFHMEFGAEIWTQDRKLS